MAINLTGEMDKLFEKYKIPKPTQKETDNLNRTRSIFFFCPESISKIEFIV